MIELFLLLSEILLSSSYIYKWIKFGYFHYIPVPNKLIAAIINLFIIIDHYLTNSIHVRKMDKLITGLHFMFVFSWFAICHSFIPIYEYHSTAYTGNKTAITIGGTYSYTGFGTSFGDCLIATMFALQHINDDSRLLEQYHLNVIYGNTKVNL